MRPQRLQRDLFEPDRPQPNIPSEQRAKLITLLGEMLGEALVAPAPNAEDKAQKEVCDE
jgi:hypothetical protein